MNRERRYQNSIRAIYAQWPIFTLIYAGIIAALILMGISAQRGLLAFVPLSLALIIILAAFFGARIWATYNIYDSNGLRPHDILFDMGQLDDTSQFVYIVCAQRIRALQLTRRLTRGHITIVDIYNPQWLPSSNLARRRKRIIPAVSDPRISWKDGHFGLLPLPNHSVKAVILCQVTSELWQEGDQETLFAEIYRILTPNGRLLLAERTNTWTNIALIDGLFYKSADYWHQKLSRAGFVVRSHQNVRGLIHCFRADKPTLAEAKQMALELDFDYK